MMFVCDWQKFEAESLSLKQLSFTEPFFNHLYVCRDVASGVGIVHSRVNAPEPVLSFDLTRQLVGR